ncbi:hypothetical protein K373_02652 [Streptomyces sp. DvalAA-21]|nr:hypothetical protein K373_02652 [Streptomyces sp. DvalAA-21]
MPKDLHDRGHVHSEFVEDRARRVTASVVEAAIAEAGFLRQVLELLPVRFRVDGPPVESGSEGVRPVGSDKGSCQVEAR